MKIVLTGITGFIGMNLMPQLSKLGKDNEYLTLNVDIEKAQMMYPSKKYHNFKHVQVSDLESVVTFNPDIVLHLAAIVTPTNNTEIILPMIAANIEFGVLLLDALQKCDNFKLFVNTGSFAEYRFGPNNFDSAYLYTATKTAFRTFVAYYAGLGKGFKYITAVPYSVYGGTMTVKRLFDYMAESLDAPTPVDMTKGEQVLDFIHVDDVAAFYAYTVAHVDEFLVLPNNGEEFHLGTGKGTSIREVAALMEDISGKKCNINWGGREYRERDIMYAVAPIEKNKCGWKAEIEIREGLRKFIERNES
jgi:CDP-paratose synthetase